jgi:hypothetical protein
MLERMFTILDVSQLEGFLESTEFKEKGTPVRIFLGSEIFENKELVKLFSRFVKVEEHTWIHVDDIMFQWKELDFHTKFIPMVSDSATDRHEMWEDFLQSSPKHLFMNYLKML